MTKESLEKGKELLERIEKLNVQKRYWKEAVSICEIKLFTPYTIYIEVDESVINFEELKLLVIASLTKEIEQLQKEFDEL